MDKLDLAKKLFFEGVAFIEAKNFNEAEMRLRKCLDLAPGRISAMINLSAALLKQSKFSEASVLVDEVLRLDETACEAWLNRGLILFEEYRLDEALDSIRRAAALCPQNAEAYNGLGIVHAKLRQHTVAMESFDQALHHNPAYVEAHVNRGNLLRDMRRYDAAFECYSRALGLAPNSADVFVSRGNLYRELRQYPRALDDYGHAIMLQRDCPDAYMGRAALFSAMKQHEAAMRDYRHALSLKPHADYLLCGLMYSQMSVCEWEHIDDQTAQLQGHVEQGRVCDPFVLLALIDDPAIQRRCAETRIRRSFPKQSDLGQLGKSSKEDARIRLGYYSADFWDHAVSRLMVEIFELHDRAKFEVIGFDFGGSDHEDEMRQRVRRSFDRFIDVQEKSDREIAEMSRAMGIDIAVDLGGFTEGARTGVFAMRAAPVQVSYIGYLGTMGAPYIDYVLADATLIPDGVRHHYTEKVAYLPSYQANDSKRHISERVFTRSELGLPENSFVFCCFCNAYKLTRETFRSWMRILDQVRDSVLFLYAENNAVQANLIREAREHGINDDRIVFGTRLPPPEYLARLRAFDLFLDTYPYTGGTTTSDSLWAGLPVLTLTGDSFASRMAASVLTAAGLPELITTTRESYEARAVEIATHPEVLASIKQKLERNRTASRLFDSRLFTKHIEHAFSKMHERVQSGLPPDHILIDEEGIAPCC